MQKFMTIAASLLATATLFAVTPGVAMAQSGTVAVRHADLDLTTTKGQQALERRITRAARAICGMDDQNTGTRIASPASSACYRQALGSVRKQVATAIENSQRGG